MTRKSRELFEARLENATLKIQIEAAAREVERAYEDLKQARTALITERDKTIKLARDVAVYKDRLDIVANHLPTSTGPTVKHMSEEVEDLEYAFRSGLIDKAELEAELQSAGFQSAEIELDLTPPRL